jgi:hypothetical protein
VLVDRAEGFAAVDKAASAITEFANARAPPLAQSINTLAERATVNANPQPLREALVLLQTHGSKL